MNSIRAVSRLALVTRRLPRAVVIVRPFSKVELQAVDPNAKKQTPPPPPPPPKDKSGTRKQRINTFLLGFGLAAVFFFYELGSSLWKSTQQMDVAVAGLRSDVVQANAKLQERVTILEKEVKKLQGN